MLLFLVLLASFTCWADIDSTEEEVTVETQEEYPVPTEMEEPVIDYSDTEEE